jgi:hypothetical protein
MLKHILQVWAPACTLAILVAFLPACQKETLQNAADAAIAFNAEDRGPGGDNGTAEHRRRRHRDSLGGHPLGDSIRHCDSIRRHHHHDSIRPHWLDSVRHHHPFDSIRPHHHDTTGVCIVPPVAITVADLPQAAKDWIAANAPAAEVVSVTKFTNRKCKVEYVVRFKGRAPVRFDADGKKK